MRRFEIGNGHAPAKASLSCALRSLIVAPLLEMRWRQVFSYFPS
jgi:hypothetical protein